LKLEGKPATRTSVPGEQLFDGNGVSHMHLTPT